MIFDCVILRPFLRFLFCLALMSTITPCLANEPALITDDWIYVAEPKESTLAQFRFTHDATSPRLEHVASHEQAKPPIVVAFSDKTGKLYVIRGFGPHAELASISVDGATGALGEERSVPIAAGGCHIAVCDQGAFALVASYNLGGVDLIGLDESGHVERLSDRQKVEGVTHAHGFAFDDSGEFVYVPHVKEHNAVFQYRLDREQGLLHPLAPLSPPSLPSGLGPRHAARHPTQPWVYFSNEQQLGVTWMAWADASRQLHFKEAFPVDLSSIESFDGTGGSASTILMAPDGQYLYSFVRLPPRDASALVVWKIGEDGALAQHAVVETPPFPWMADLSTDGRFLYVVSFFGARLGVYAREKQGASPVLIIDRPIAERVMSLASMPVAR